MKKQFDILAISPTQWVLVGTLGPNLRISDTPQRVITITGGFGGLLESCYYGPESDWLMGRQVVLAAYPKIEGVLLLPSTLWEKPNGLQAALEKEGSMNDYSLFTTGFERGYEAAGGYTKEQMRKAFDWGATLQGADETLDEKEFDAFLSELKSHSPRALEIEVGEDGSIPSENGVIIYNKAIY